MTNLTLDKALPGRTPLVRVFWLYGVIPSNLLWALTFYLFSVGAQPAAIVLMLLILLIYTGWVVPAVWQSADNVGNPAYGVMARWLTVAWAVNTLLMIGFLLLDLLA